MGSPPVEPPSGYSIELLDPALHQRDNFSCGIQELDDYLRTQASQSQTKYLSATHVLVEAGQGTALRPVIGYVSLLNSEIPLTVLPNAYRKLTNKTSLPAILLARMAVHQRYQGKGFGELLLKYAIKRCWEISRLSGCFAVVLDAKDNARDFYLKYGFLALPDDRSRLFLPIQTIDKLSA